MAELLAQKKGTTVNEELRSYNDVAEMLGIENNRNMMERVFIRMVEAERINPIMFGEN